jgi:DNA helicase II / ATP-dependent DNA helicase PcrA
MDNPSPYQQAIFDYIKNRDGNLIVKAVAGSGKTTTAVESLKFIPSDKKVLFLAFNKAIATTLQQRVPGNVKASTFHSCGYQALKSVNQRYDLDNNKVYEAIRKMFELHGWIIPDGEKYSFFSKIEKIVNLMRLSLATTREDCIKICRQFDFGEEDNEVNCSMQVFEEISKPSLLIDFTDMVYLPAVMDLPLRKYDVVYVDEMQDVSNAQFAMARKLLTPNGRMIMIGDPNQSIYQYIGASAEIFDKAMEIPNTVELPLSISYRCSKEVVKYAQKLVAEIEPHDLAAQGVVVHDGSINNVKDGDFVLCRTNAPLARLCTYFIKNGQKASIKGADVGRQIASFLKTYETKPLDKALQMLNSRLTKMYLRLSAKYPGRNIEALFEYQAFGDKISIVEAFAEESETVMEVISKAKTMFSDGETDGITLSTVHKAKGLEAKNVFIIEPQLIPFPYYTTPSERKQEANIDYVARTRAIDRLEYVRDWTSFNKLKKNIKTESRWKTPEQKPAIHHGAISSRQVLNLSTGNIENAKRVSLFTGDQPKEKKKRGKKPSFKNSNQS